MLCHYTNVKEKKRKGRKETRRKDNIIRILSKRSGAGWCQNLASKTIVVNKYSFRKMQTFPQFLESPPQHPCSTSKYSVL